MNLSRKVMGVLVAAMAVAAVFLVNPLRMPDAALHAWLLKTVPVGSNLETLQAAVKRNGWRLNGTWQGHRPKSDWGGIDGDTVAWVYLGGYRSILRTDIDSFWAFDDHGKLMDVHTRRTADAL